MPQSWTKIVDKFTKLSKIGFCMEYITAHFSKILPKNVEISYLWWLDGFLLSNSGISIYSLKFSTSLRF